MSDKKTAGELRQDYIGALGEENFKCIHLQLPDGKCIDCGDCEYNDLTPLEIEVKRLQKEHHDVRKCAREAWAAGVRLAGEWSRTMDTVAALTAEKYEALDERDVARNRLNELSDAQVDAAVTIGIIKETKGTASLDEATNATCAMLKEIARLRTALYEMRERHAGGQ